MAHRRRRVHTAAIAIVTTGLALTASTVAFAAGDSARPAQEASGIVARKFEGSSVSLAPVELRCLGTALQDYRWLTRATLRARSLGRLSDANQVALFGLAVKCAPATTGRAAFARFAETQPRRTSSEMLGEMQYRCIAERAVFQYPPGAVAKALIVDLPNGTINSEHMTMAGQTLFACMREYVTNGPLADRFGITSVVARCVAGALTHAAGLAPMAAAVVFGRSEIVDSPELMNLVSSCSDNAVTDQD